MTGTHQCGALLMIEVMTMLANSLAVTTVAVTDIDRAKRFYQEQVGLKNFIAQVGPARGAWFKDPDGNVLGVREGPVPAAG